jgi:hypothetical protein
MVLGGTTRGIGQGESIVTLKIDSLLATRKARTGNLGIRFAIALLAVLAFSLSVRAQASDVYVTQTGTDPGAGWVCNGKSNISISTFNNAGTWGAQIGPGTTVHFCGNFTSPFQIHGSGKAGNVITFLYDCNAGTCAKQTGSVMNFWPSAGYILLNGNNYLLFDGGTQNAGKSGVQGGSIVNMEATDNGSALPNQHGIHGFYAPNSHDIEVRNMGFYNLYVHTSQSDGSCGADCAAYYFGQPVGVNVSIHDNTMGDQYDGAMADCITGVFCNLQFYRNYLFHIQHGLLTGPVSSGTAKGVFNHDNRYSNPGNWDTTANTFHHDGLILIWGNSSYLDTYVEYNNLYDGDWGGHTTSPIFFDSNVDTVGYLSNVYIFNDVFDGSTTSGGWANGINLIVDTKNQSSSGPVYVYNNTVICPKSSNGSFGVTGNNNDFRNNVETSCTGFFGTSGFTAGSPAQFDYNVYFNMVPSGNSAFGYDGPSSGSGSLATQFTNWKTLMQQRLAEAESHSQEAANANFGPRGLPQAQSIVAGSGKNLSSLCTGNLVALCSDTSAGNTRTPSARPASGAWDVGAYMISSGTTTTTLQPPTALAASVN